mmetsp:Transcript_32869/g.50256  ORF Transcript_32869/g.50256 Transcript_32869/m.50256 type:complete len:93 (-) Transcript_32869:30-308(-)
MFGDDFDIRETNATDRPLSSFVQDFEKGFSGQGLQILVDHDPNIKFLQMENKPDLDYLQLIANKIVLTILQSRTFLTQNNQGQKSRNNFNKS